MYRRLRQSSAKFKAYLKPQAQVSTEEEVANLQSIPVTHSAHTELSPWVTQRLSRLDDRLAEVLESGDIRLVRTEWLLAQPPEYRMRRCQDLETLERSKVSPSPLLTRQEATKFLREGNRCIAASLPLVDPEYDPARARIDLVRAAPRETPQGPVLGLASLPHPRS